MGLRATAIVRVYVSRDGRSDDRDNERGQRSHSIVVVAIPPVSRRFHFGIFRVALIRPLATGHHRFDCSSSYSSRLEPVGEYTGRYQDTARLVEEGRARNGKRLTSNPTTIVSLPLPHRGETFRFSCQRREKFARLVTAPTRATNE